jgi:hypothetical protein
MVAANTSRERFIFVIAALLEILSAGRAGEIPGRVLASFYFNSGGER